MKIASDAWILVADGEKYLVLRNEGSPAAPHLQVIRESEAENPPTREQGSDRPGRMAGPAPTVAAAGADGVRRAGARRSRSRRSR